MIYTCYSYKGGVGRSMALANIAALLWEKGLRVLMIDFDLEAPGLEQYFYRKDDQQFLRVLSQRGIIDLLQSYKSLRSLPPDLKEEATSNPAEVGSTPGESLPADETFPYLVEPLNNFIWEIHPRSSQNPGELLLMPAGRREREIRGTDGETTFEDDFAAYADHVRAFSWEDFYLNFDGEDFFNAFYEKILKRADIVLIDSRTGVAEMSGVCTYQLADVVVMFVAPNNQNIDGTKKIASSLVGRDDLIRKRYKQRKLSVIFVPSRVDSSEKEKVDDLARRFREVASRLASPDLTFEVDTFTDLTIPYIPYYSFVEELVAKDTVSPAALSLKKAYENICRTFAQFDPEISEKMKSEVIDPSRVNLAEQQDRLAEHAYSKLKPFEQLIAHSLFTRLVRVALPEEGERKDTAKDVKLADLWKSQRDVAQLLEKEKLLILGKDSAGQEIVGLADEGLIQNWRRFEDWINKDREFLTWRQKLQTSVLEWDKSGRHFGYLLSGSKYLEAEKWYALQSSELSSVESAYIEASRARRRRERLGNYFRVAAALLVFATTAFLIYRYWFKDNSSAAETRSRQLASNSEAVRSYLPEQSLLLAVEAVRLSPTAEAQRALRNVLLQSRLRTVIRVGGTVYSAQFSHDGRRIVTGSGTYNVAQIWEPANVNRWQNLLILKGHEGEVRAAAFSPNDQLVATASHDGTSILWNALTGQMIGPRAPVSHMSLSDLAWSPDGRFVAASSLATNQVNVWEVPEMELVKTLAGFTDNVNSVSFSPNGLYLAAGSRDNRVLVWDVKTGKQVAPPLFGHTNEVLSVRFSPDGKFLVTTGGENTARVWSTSDWKTITVFSEHFGPVTRASFSPDGKLIVTASADNSAKIWETLTGKMIAELRGSLSAVNDASFSPDGNLILTASSDGTARLWDLNPDIGSNSSMAELTAIACTRVTRNLTESEWRQYMGNEPYRPTCPDIPLTQPKPTPTATQEPLRSSKSVPSPDKRKWG